jgi:hypothetical protein
VIDGEDILSETPGESTPVVSESSKPDESSSNLEESSESDTFGQTAPEQNLPQESSQTVLEETKTPQYQGEVETPTFETYEEYLAFINGFEKLPDDFITYDMLKDIGEFEMFIASKSLIEYEYTFKDDNNKRIHMKIEPLPNKIQSSTVVFSDNIIDFRKIVSNGERSYNDITYGYYFDGALSTIRWSIGKKLVKLTCSGDSNSFADYPLDGETTFVSQLLSTQTATAAVQSFNQKVEAEIAKNIANKQFES